MATSFFLSEDQKFLSSHQTIPIAKTLISDPALYCIHVSDLVIFDLSSISEPFMQGKTLYDERPLPRPHIEIKTQTKGPKLPS